MPKTVYIKGTSIGADADYFIIYHTAVNYTNRIGEPVYRRSQLIAGVTIADVPDEATLFYISTNNGSCVTTGTASIVPTPTPTITPTPTVRTMTIDTTMSITFDERGDYCPGSPVGLTINASAAWYVVATPSGNNELYPSSGGSGGTFVVASPGTRGTATTFQFFWASDNTPTGVYAYASNYNIGEMCS